MNKRPFFSIVLPTLNRAKYLPFAIQSILNQSFEDFELIISDNSSIDDTEKVVKQFSDARIRYVKTEKTLTMPLSWEFALSQAIGEYITFLGDDDAYSKIYLESFSKIIAEHKVKVISCKMADYYYQGLKEPVTDIEPESLVTNPFTNELFTYKAADLIKTLYVNFGLSKGQTTPQIQMPQLINAVYHNSVFTLIKNKFGYIFPSVLSVDYYLSVVVLSFIDDYYYLDSPLSFHGISNNSTTSSIDRRKKDSNLKEIQPELARFEKVPIDFLSPYNFVADALLVAKSNIGEKLNYFDINLTGYFVTIYQLLHASELKGNDITLESRKLISIVSRQNKQIQNDFNLLALNKINLFKNKLRLKLYSMKFFRIYAKLRKNDKRIIFEGKKNGFNNIVECGNIVEYNFLQKEAIKKSSFIYV